MRKIVLGIGIFLASWGLGQLQEVQALLPDFENAIDGDWADAVSGSVVRDGAKNLGRTVGGVAGIVTDGAAGLTEGINEGLGNSTEDAVEQLNMLIEKGKDVKEIEEQVKCVKELLTKGFGSAEIEKRCILSVGPDGSFALPSAEKFNQAQTTSLRTFILDALNFVLGFLGIVAVAVIIYSGYTYVTASEDESRAEKAKNMIIWVSIGLVIILVSFAYVNTIITHLPTGGEDERYCSENPDDPDCIGGADTEINGTSAEGDVDSFYQDKGESAENIIVGTGLSYDSDVTSLETSTSSELYDGSGISQRIYADLETAVSGLYFQVVGAIDGYVEDNLDNRANFIRLKNDSTDQSKTEENCARDYHSADITNKCQFFKLPFTQGGSYSINGEFVDASNVVHNFSRTIVIGQFSAEIQSSSDLLVTVGDSVALTANVENLPYSTTSTYAWSGDDDSSDDTGVTPTKCESINGSNSTLTYEFDVLGDCVITLTVTNSLGWETTDTVTFTANDEATTETISAQVLAAGVGGAGNVSETSDGYGEQIYVDLAAGAAGVDFKIVGAVDGSVTIDGIDLPLVDVNNSSISNNDGLITEADDTTPDNFTYNFYDSGSYALTGSYQELDNRNTYEFSKTIIVGDLTPSIVASLPPVLDQEVTFTANVTTPSGSNVTGYTWASVAPESSSGITNACAGVSSNSKTLTLDFDTAGTCELTLTATNNLGWDETATVEYEINEEAGGTETTSAQIFASTVEGSTANHVSTTSNGYGKDIYLDLEAGAAGVDFKIIGATSGEVTIAGVNLPLVDVSNTGITDDDGNAVEDTTDADADNFNYEFYDSGAYALTGTYYKTGDSTAYEFSKTIIVGDLTPTIVAASDPDTVGETVTFTANVTTPSGSNVTGYTWAGTGDACDGVSSNSKTLTLEFTTAGTCTLTLTAANNLGWSEPSESVTYNILEDNTTETISAQVLASVGTNEAGNVTTPNEGLNNKIFLDLAAGASGVDFKIVGATSGSISIGEDTFKLVDVDNNSLELEPNATTMEANDNLNKEATEAVDAAEEAATATESVVTAFTAVDTDKETTAQAASDATNAATNTSGAIDTTTNTDISPEVATAIQVVIDSVNAAANAASSASTSENTTDAKTHAGNARTAADQAEIDYGAADSAVTTANDGATPETIDANNAALGLAETAVNDAGEAAEAAEALAGTDNAEGSFTALDNAKGTAIEKGNAAQLAADDTQAAITGDTSNTVDAIALEVIDAVEDAAEAALTAGSLTASNSGGELANTELNNANDAVAEANDQLSALGVAIDNADSTDVTDNFSYNFYNAGSYSLSGTYQGTDPSGNTGTFEFSKTIIVGDLTPTIVTASTPDTVGQEVTFTANVTTPSGSNVTGYTWEGTGDACAGVSSNSKTLTLEFTTAGTCVLTLTAANNLGWSEPTSETYTITAEDVGTQSVTAQVNVTSNSGNYTATNDGFGNEIYLDLTAGEAGVTFTVVDATSGSITVNNVEKALDASGKATYNFYNTGSYSLTGEYLDSTGSSFEFSKTIIVGDLTPTIVEASPPDTVGETITFTANVTTPSGSNVTGYTWAGTGDACDGVSSNSKTLTYKFEATGTCTLTLTATNNLGWSETTEVTYTIAEDTSNTSVSVSTNAQVEAVSADTSTNVYVGNDGYDTTIYADSAAGAAGLTFKVVDAVSGTVTINNAELTLEDIDVSNGSFDDDAANNFSYTFREVGTYSMNGTYEDGAGGNYSFSKTVIIMDLSAEISENTTVETVNDTIILSAVATTPSGTSITSYAWAGDSAGNCTDWTDTGTSTQYTFATAGECKVTLTVENSLGWTDTDETSFVIAEDTSSTVSSLLADNEITDTQIQITEIGGTTVVQNDGSEIGYSDNAGYSTYIFADTVAASTGLTFTIVLADGESLQTGSYSISRDDGDTTAAILPLESGDLTNVSFTYAFPDAGIYELEGEYTYTNSQEAEISNTFTRKVVVDSLDVAIGSSLSSPTINTETELWANVDNVTYTSVSSYAWGCEFWETTADPESDDAGECPGFSVVGSSGLYDWPAAGTYDLTLTVVNSLGWSEIATKTYSVSASSSSSTTTTTTTGTGSTIVTAEAASDNTASGVVFVGNDGLDPYIVIDPEVASGGVTFTVANAVSGEVTINGNVTRVFSDENGDAVTDNFTHSFYTPGSHSLSGSYYDSAGGYYSFTRTVIVDELEVSIAASFTPTYTGDTVTFTAQTTTPLSTNVNNYSWSCSGTCSAFSGDEKSAEYTFSEEGTYTITVRVTNTAGQTASDSKTYEIEENPISVTQ